MLAQKGIAAAKIPHIKYHQKPGKHQQNVIKCLGKCETSLRQILCKVGAISRPQIAPVVIVLGNRSPPFYLVIISTARTSAFRQMKRGKEEKGKMSQNLPFELWVFCMVEWYASMHIAKPGQQIAVLAKESLNLFSILWTCLVFIAK